MDQAKFRAALDRCLLTDAEMALGVKRSQRFYDPLPPWPSVREILADDEHAHH
jgi:hypothetical protein